MFHFYHYLTLFNPRWGIVSRIIAAVFGGYALATSSSIFISQLLLSSLGRYQAIHVGLLFTFIIYACAIMWVFSVSTALQAWFGLLKVNIICAVGALLLIWFMGR